MATEELSLDFTAESIEEIATLAAEINASVENIGARRLQTVMEKLLEDISFSASERSGEAIVISAEDVRTRVGALAKSADLARFIL
jgi:ATP-dependent HslUV protease ATP-binding subunit HslU